jgi:hypothetical protein
MRITHQHSQPVPISPSTCITLYWRESAHRKLLLSFNYRRARGNYAGFFFCFVRSSPAKKSDRQTLSSNYCRDAPSKFFTAAKQHRISQTLTSGSRKRVDGKHKSDVIIDISCCCVRDYRRILKPIRTETPSVEHTPNQNLTFSTVC